MMKNKIILCLLFALYSTGIKSQNLSGNYYSDSGICLKIQQDTFKLIMPNAARNGFSSEILAEGMCKQIDKSFIELNSFTNPIHEILKDIKVIQEVKYPPTDSIKIKFTIPYQKDKLKIVIFTDNYKNYNFYYSKNSQEVIIPGDVSSISFYIAPSYISPITTEGLFYGIAVFESMGEYQINNNSNYVEIKIPGLNDSFFEKYYVKGEYARIIKNSIRWKGVVFKKR